MATPVAEDGSVGAGTGGTLPGGIASYGLGAVQFPAATLAAVT